MTQAAENRDFIDWGDLNDEIGIEEPAPLSRGVSGLIRKVDYPRLTEEQQQLTGLIDLLIDSVNYYIEKIQTISQQDQSELAVQTAQFFDELELILDEHLSEKLESAKSSLLESFITVLRQRYVTRAALGKFTKLELSDLTTNLSNLMVALIPIRAEGNLEDLENQLIYTLEISLLRKYQLQEIAMHLESSQNNEIPPELIRRVIRNVIKLEGFPKLALLDRMEQITSEDDLCELQNNSDPGLEQTLLDKIRSLN